MILLKQMRGVFAVCLVLATASIVHASGASFVISSEGPALGKPDDGEIPKYTLKLEVGQTAVLTAQGMVTPRGGEPKPSAAEKAAWVVEDGVLQRVPEKAKDDKKDEKKEDAPTKITVKALKEGKTRVRFEGTILNYERKYDVMVEIVAAKK